MNRPDPSSETTGHVMRWAVPFYDSINRLILLDRRYRRLLREHGDLRPGHRILDVGCGTGNLLLFAQESLEGRGDAVGVDPSPWMLERARQKAARRPLPVDFQKGVIEALPFPDETFDRVFSTLMFHHLPADVQKRGLKEIRRVLKPGGRALIVDFSAVRNPLFLFFVIHFGNRSFRNQMVRGLGPLLEAAGFARVIRLEKWMGAVEVYEVQKGGDRPSEGHYHDAETVESEIGSG
ncbi:MAG: class I SAM-dependent methyltransferase [Planctomycetota bacterium]|jgi:ubiquinone/menaquinone biosynthesis C-methylase UbiE